MEQPLWIDRRRSPKGPRILVAGLGNLLLRDDGLGVHAVRRFQRPLADEFRAVDVGCSVLDALHLFEWAERILLIDAMESGESPGTVFWVRSIDDLEEGGLPASLHELSVVQALRMIRKNPRPDIAIIGVQPEIIDYGLTLSNSVESAIPLVLQTGQEIIREWLKDYHSQSTDQVIQKTDFGENQSPFLE